MIDTYDLQNYLSSAKNLIITDPIGYLDFMQLMQNARLILTDSGGIQEETTYLGIPCITIRENTERPVTIDLGTNVLVGPHAEGIIEETKKILTGNGKKGQVPELWDGHAAERIVKILAEKL
jgi:UDP-N-acetylglucosamine 2-epimerase (non-hydrolysing)